MPKKPKKASVDDRDRNLQTPDLKQLLNISLFCTRLAIYLLKGTFSSINILVNLKIEKIYAIKYIIIAINKCIAYIKE